MSSTGKYTEHSDFLIWGRREGMNIYWGLIKIRPWTRASFYLMVMKMRGCGVITPVYRWEQRVQNVRIFQVKELGNGDLELKPEGLDSRTHDISFFFFFSLKFSYSGRNWKKKSFVHFWRCWVLAVASGPSPVVVNRGSSLAEVWEFLTAVVSLVVGCGLHTQGLQSLWHMGFSVLSQKLPHSTWDLPGPGIEPVSPALAGRFPTMAPPGKSLMTVLFLS